MAMTDPIADMLTRVRNACKAKLPVVDIPASNLKREIARVLQEKGFIKKFVVVDDGKQGILKVPFLYRSRNTLSGHKICRGKGNAPADA